MKILSSRVLRALERFNAAYPWDHNDHYHRWILRQLPEPLRSRCGALGRAAVGAGHRVCFTTAAGLAAKCHKAALEGRWKTCMRFFGGPKHLIIDELDYLPLPEDGASALFQVINQRFLKSSTILATTRFVRVLDAGHL